ncbi:Ku protein [Nitrospirillum amazonense]|uniref:non-homologous end joining protein Ku n=1 Tax=Nitrospirillum amazonense TaxID=28077 RepID=UPI002DD43C4A|nr:Ku protein [Nitrospirillum amazonense]MEC4592107.1 Ku protein [Nitrospirillum amazonense]
MAPRANWKGFLKIGEVSCSVALYTAASSSERIAFHTVNRATGHRVHRQFVDSETGKPVDREDQVKGYEVARGDYVVLEPEEVAAVVPESDKTLSVLAFIPCADIDDVYFDKPYYLAPSDRHADEAFALIREGMRAKKVAALAQTVLFRRVRTVLVRAHGAGLIATTLNFDYEVRSAAQAFDEIADIKIEGEMLDLARHIIETKKGVFKPADFDDRYEAALADMVKAKLEGKVPPARKRAPPTKTTDLMAALRESAGLAGKPVAKKAASNANRAKSRSTRAAPKPKAVPARRKAS